MSEHLWWYVARSGGIVALALATLSVIWGLLLSTRILEGRPRASTLRRAHQWLGGATVLFTGFHLLGLYLDNYVDFGFTELFVPFASAWKPGPVAWGIVATYLLAAVQGTSMMMHRMPRRLWKWIHLSSFGILVTGFVHGATAGTDASSPYYIGGAVGLVMLSAFLTVYRLVTARRTGLLAGVGG